MSGRNGGPAASRSGGRPSPGDLGHVERVLFLVGLLEEAGAGPQDYIPWRHWRQLVVRVTACSGTTAERCCELGEDLGVLVHVPGGIRLTGEIPDSPAVESVLGPSA